MSFKSKLCYPPRSPLPVDWQVWFSGPSAAPYVVLDLPLFIDCAFCAGAAMIAFGAVLGKATPAQLLWLMVLMVPSYSLNQHLVCG